MERADISQFHEVHKLLIARMRCELHDGQRSAALATVIESLQLTHRWQVAHNTSLVELLVAATTSGSALKSLAEIVSLGDFDGSKHVELDICCHAIESALRIRPVYLGERAMAMTMIENFYENGGMDGEPITNPILQLVLQPLVWNNQTHYLRAIGPMVDYADCYDDEASKATEEAWMQEIAPLEDGKVHGLGKVSRMAVALLIPATASVERAVVDNRNRLNSARVGLLVDAYFREHGRFPKSLDEVVGENFPPIPKDIVHGEPLVLLVEGNAFAVCAADVRERERKLLIAEIKKQDLLNNRATDRNDAEEIGIEVENAEAVTTDEEEYSTAFRVIYRARPAEAK